MTDGSGQFPAFLLSRDGKRAYFSRRHLRDACDFPFGEFKLLEDVLDSDLSIRKRTKEEEDSIPKLVQHYREHFKLKNK